MEVKRVPISSLIKDPLNARKHPKKNIDAIKGSLKKFGQVEPLVVNSLTGVIIGGNGRLEAMKELGFDEVDIVEVPLDNTQAAALALALNRTSETAEWDDKILKTLLEGLNNDGFELDEIGFDLDDIEPQIDAPKNKKMKICPECGHEW